MEYYKLLKLEREPFSNSPDPNYFFQSRQHQACLQKIELAIRLKRGLNVVIGDMGTGKTTLCRELIRRLAQQESFETHLILDPAFGSGNEMLESIYKMLYNRFPEGRPSAIDLKEAIKHALFDKGVCQKHTVVIIIDEGQKISSSCVEILRELLNYETNEFKLLQIIIFAQKEFNGILDAHANFADRINLLHQLSPMSFKDTRRMIRHRLKMACSEIKPLDLFSLPAQWAIYRSTRGYPRRIIHLCHQSLLTMIIQNRTRAGWKLIQSCRIRMLRPSNGKFFRPAGLAVVMAALVLVLLIPFFWQYFDYSRQSRRHFKVPPQTPQALEDSAIQAGALNKTVPTRPMNATTAAQPTDHIAPASSPAPALETEKPQWEAQVAAKTFSPPSPVPVSEKPEKPERQVAPAPPPTQLGRLTIKAGDTISAIVIQVYGSYHNNCIQAVLDANPHIQAPDNIQLGESILLPAVDFKVKAASVDCHWVVLDRCGHLIEALRLSDTFSRILHTSTRPMALWSPGQGLYFELLLKGYFRDRESARRYADTLPPEISQAVRIINGWNDDIRIYSDPYAGGIRQRIGE